MIGEGERGLSGTAATGAAEAGAAGAAGATSGRSSTGATGATGTTGVTGITASGAGPMESVGVEWTEWHDVPCTVRRGVGADGRGGEDVQVTLSVPFTRGREQWVVLFEYGAAVFFNCDERRRHEVLQSVLPFCADVKELGAAGPRLREELSYGVDPDLPKWHQLQVGESAIADDASPPAAVAAAASGRRRRRQGHAKLNLVNEKTLMLHRLDLNTIRVVAGVLGQTVALHYYEREVDSMLEVFKSINTGIVRSGGVGARKNGMFKLVASNNSLHTDIILNLKLLDRARPGEAVWNYDAYQSLWETLQEEFELQQRFQSIDFKLELIQNNIK